MHKDTIKKNVIGYLAMFVACIFYGLSTILFLRPNSIVAGGVSGLSVLINIINEKIPIGLISIAINVPILLLGLKYQGWKFIVKCLLTVVTLGLVTDLLDQFLPCMTDNKILACLYGGVCQGIGIGLFVRFEFSSGGTELLGRVISRWVKVLNIPVCVGILDAVIVVIGAIITESPDNILYALIVVFVSTKVSEVVLMGLDKSKLCIIISDKGEEIANTLIKNSPRGVTMWDGMGMYTQRERDVLLTCVKTRQVQALKAFVKDIDNNAFIIINDAVEVRGKGFQTLDKE